MLRGWIEASVKYAADELVQGRLASSDAISRLSELLLVEAVRHYSSQLSADEIGRLNGVRDTRIGRAISLIHRELAAPWSVEALDREVLLSSDAFEQRFTSAVGISPATYLTRWRLKATQYSLRETPKPIGQIASQAGYASEDAFNEELTEHLGQSPERWREERAAPPAPATTFEFVSVR